MQRLTERALRTNALFSHWAIAIESVPTMGTINFCGIILIKQRQTSKETFTVPNAIIQCEWTLSIYKNKTSDHTLGTLWS